MNRLKVTIALQESPKRNLKHPWLGLFIGSCFFVMMLLPLSNVFGQTSAAALSNNGKPNATQQSGASADADKLDTDEMEGNIQPKTDIPDRSNLRTMSTLLFNPQQIPVTKRMTVAVREDD